VRLRLRQLRQLVERSPGVALIIALSLVVPMTRGIPILSIATLLLAFVLPGLAILAALLPRAVLLQWESIPVALGMSAVVVIAIGLVLDVTPGGLSPGPWMLLLTVITVVAGILALVRRSEEIDWDADVEPSRLTWPQRAEGVQLGLALGIVVLVLVIARLTGAVPQTHFTELSLVPGSAPGSIELAIANHEGQTAAYEVVVRIEGQPSQRLAVALDDDASWTRSFSAGAAVAVEVSADLYLLPDRTQPYRSATFTLPAGAG